MGQLVLLRRRTDGGRAAVAGAGGVQRVRVEVKGGYTPALIRVRAGSPVRLDFHRDETNTCTEEVVIPDFGIRTFLPAHRTTTGQLHARGGDPRIHLRHGDGARHHHRGEQQLSRS